MSKSGTPAFCLQPGFGLPCWHARPSQAEETRYSHQPENRAAFFGGGNEEAAAEATEMHTGVRQAGGGGGGRKGGRRGRERARVAGWCSGGRRREPGTQAPHA